MLEFRKGNADQGRKLYLKAIESAKAVGDKDDAVRALFHLLFEEIRSGSDHFDNALNRLTQMEERNDVVETPRHLERMRKLLEDKQ